MTFMSLNGFEDLFCYEKALQKSWGARGSGSPGFRKTYRWLSFLKIIIKKGYIIDALRNRQKSMEKVHIFLCPPKCRKSMKSFYILKPLENGGKVMRCVHILALVKMYFFDLNFCMLIWIWITEYSFPTIDMYWN